MVEPCFDERSTSYPLQNYLMRRKCPDSRPFSNFISDRIQQWYRNRKHFGNTKMHMTLKHSAGGHQGSQKAHQAGKQKYVTSEYGDMGFNCFLEFQGYLLWALIISILSPEECVEHMMTSSNGNIFRVNGHLCGEFTGHRWIPRTKASDAELWCFLWSAPE